MIYRGIISGQAGLWALPVRALLRLISLPYGWIVRLRNRRFDHPARCTRVSVPVISVGNLTVGGTGKTPLVIELAQRLVRGGRRPAIVARGYKAPAGHPNDEERLIRAHCPQAVYLADADRVRGARRAIAEQGADVIVLDDGFQHRRLARALDIVVIDATCPFGYGALLPRGLLREPLDALRRAGLIVVSRCDQASAEELTRLDERLAQAAPNTPRIQCHHRVTEVVRLDGAPLDRPLTGARVVLFAAIGNPAAFRATVESLGAAVIAERWWPDHHTYNDRDLAWLTAPHRFPAHDLLLTTEKDGVKLHHLPGAAAAHIGVVRIAIDFAADGGTILDERLEECLRHASVTELTA